ncbi:hypothetical protein GJ496_004320 [Pomphorhynchus laevis]|nr:hypothetical protein GJ496_004320 [Pomphorhynchus laevis]
MPSLDDTLGAMLLHNPLPVDKLNSSDFNFENDGNFKSNLHINNSLSYHDHQQRPHYDSLDADQFNDDTFDCFSDLSTIEFINSKMSPSTSNWKRSTNLKSTNGIDNFNNSTESVDYFGTDKQTHSPTDSEHNQEIIKLPKIRYDNCFDEFLNAYEQKMDFNAVSDSRLQSILTSEETPWKQQDESINLSTQTAKIPDALTNLPADMSKSQVTKASKLLSRELRKHILDLDKLEMAANSSLMNASQQAAVDFKQLRQAVIDREADVLSGLRRLKDNTGKAIRRQRGSCQNLQKSTDINNGDLKKLKNQIDAYQRILNEASQLPFSTLRLQHSLVAIRCILRASNTQVVIQKKFAKFQFCCYYSRR